MYEKDLSSVVKRGYLSPFTCVKTLENMCHKCPQVYVFCPTKRAKTDLAFLLFSTKTRTNTQRHRQIHKDTNRSLSVSCFGFGHGREVPNLTAVSCFGLPNVNRARRSLHPSIQFSLPFLPSIFQLQKHIFHAISSPFHEFFINL